MSYPVWDPGRAVHLSAVIGGLTCFSGPLIQLQFISQHQTIIENRATRVLYASVHTLVWGQVNCGSA
jgi:hypothetical protein